MASRLPSAVLGLRPLVGPLMALSPAQLQGVLEATGEGILVRGAEGRLLWANAEAARLIGVASVEELLALPLDRVAQRFEVFDQHGHRLTSRDFPGRRALRSGASEEAILRYREIATGEERWVLIRAQELLDADGTTSGSVSVFRDITLRQNALLAREDSEQRLAFLASIGPQLLAASLDYRDVLEGVAELLVPRMADYCSVREIHQDGSAQRLAVRHADPSKAELVRRLESYPLEERGAFQEEIQAGRPVLMRQLSAQQLRRAARDSEHLRLMEELNPRSALAMPVQARGRTVGLILLIWAESGRQYGDADVLMVEDVARRAGLAIDNARLFEEERLAREQAERTRGEIAFLLDASTVLAGSLDYEESLRRLAGLATSALCDLCLVDLLDPSDGSVHRVAAVSAHAEEQALVDRLKQHYAPDPLGEHPAIQVMRSGVARHARSMAEDFMTSTTRDEQHRQITQELGFQSYISVPLEARGRILGALTLIATHRSGRIYHAEDVALASDLARRAALALDNARLYQETEFQKALLTSQSEAALEGVLVVSPSGRIISHNHRFIALWSLPEDLLGGEGGPGVMNWMRQQVQDPERFDAVLSRLEAHPGESARDELALLDGRVLDRWSAPLTGATVGEHGRAWYFRDITDIKAVQAERSRLYEAERRTRLEAERSRSQLAFLLEASTLLGGSLDIQAALTSLAQLVTRSLADVCVICLASGDELHQIAGATSWRMAGDPALSDCLPGWQPAFTQVIRDKTALLVADNATSEALHGVPTSLISYLVAPLLARGRPLGAVALGRAAGGAPPYDHEDLVLAQDLARRIALAVEHTRLYEAERHVAATLQRSLRPPDPPAIPGVQLAARYRPGSAQSEVGGDFYDVFPAPDDAWAVVIGDISGKGVEAASLTALARYTVRAAAREHAQPREVLVRLNQAVMEERPSGMFLTIAFARLRWRPDGSLRLTVACGGHPPPLLLRSRGPVELAGRPGTLIGFLAAPELPEKVTELAQDDVIVFFTDGLTDVRGPAGTFGEERLIALLQEYRGLEAEEIASRLESEVLAFQNGEQGDDLAILVLKVLGQPDRAAPEFTAIQPEFTSGTSDAPAREPPGR